MSTTPIADYALLSDSRSAAPVSRGGSVDWLCFPRFDRPAVLARLLDERAGRWSIRTVHHAEVRRGYIGATMAVETTFVTATGTATLVDELAVGRNERGHELGLDSPGVTAAAGNVCAGASGDGARVRVAAGVRSCPPSANLSALDGGVMARGGADRLLLSRAVSSTI